MALRGVAVAAFIVFTTIIFVNIDPQVWSPQVLVTFAIETRNFISTLITILSWFGGQLLGYVFGLGQEEIIQIYEATNAYFAALGFGSVRTIDQAIPAFLNSLYLLSFQLLFLAAILAGILSLFRISGRLTSMCFVSMIGLAMLGAAAPSLAFLGTSTSFFGPTWSTDSNVFLNPGVFFTSTIFLVAIICYIYLEASYQVVYFHSLLEPTSIREEQLQRQLSRLRSDAAREIPVRRDEEVPVPKVLQRMLGSEAFRVMREVIEKKLLRREWLVELEEAHEIRRLNSFVDNLFRVDNEAELTLTARAATPSLSKMAALSLISTVLRFAGIVIVAYLSFYPLFFIGSIAPSVIVESIDFQFLTEKIIILLLPLCLLFPLSATIIGRLRQRNPKTEDTTDQSQQ
jgi:hypothetical protein